MKQLVLCLFAVGLVASSGFAGTEPESEFSGSMVVFFKPFGAHFLLSRSQAEHDMPLSQCDGHTGHSRSRRRTTSPARNGRSDFSPVMPDDALHAERMTQARRRKAAFPSRYQGAIVDYLINCQWSVASCQRFGPSRFAAAPQTGHNGRVDLRCRRRPPPLDEYALDTLRVREWF